MENGQQRMITTYEYGNPEADVVLIQLTGEHELAVLENEVKEIRKRASSGELDFRFIAAKVENWNDELSPWKAPAVFKNEDFEDDQNDGFKLAKTIDNGCDSFTEEFTRRQSRCFGATACRFTF